MASLLFSAVQKELRAVPPVPVFVAPTKLRKDCQANGTPSVQDARASNEGP
jgi:hypothetical protein